jgi:hypothetical protein
MVASGRMCRPEAALCDVSCRGAAASGRSYPTVKTHIRSVYRKLGVSSRRAAVHSSDSRRP